MFQRWREWEWDRPPTHSRGRRSRHNRCRRSCGGRSTRRGGRRAPAWVGSGSGARSDRARIPSVFGGIPVNFAWQGSGPPILSDQHQQGRPLPLPIMNHEEAQWSPTRTTHHEVLQEACAALQAKVGAPGEVTGLLEKDGVGAVDLADVDLDVLRVGRSCSSQRRRVGRAFISSFARLRCHHRRERVHGWR